MTETLKIIPISPAPLDDLWEDYQLANAALKAYPFSQKARMRNDLAYSRWREAYLEMDKNQGRLF